MTTNDHVAALRENNARSGRVHHTFECDVLFAAFQTYTIDRGDPLPSHSEPRDCECERASVTDEGRDDADDN